MFKNQYLITESKIKIKIPDYRLYIYGEFFIYAHKKLNVSIKEFLADSGSFDPRIIEIT